MFSVWSRVASGSSTRVMPRRVQPGQQHRRLHLRRRHRHAVFQRQRALARPRSPSGSRPPSREAKRAPQADSGSITRRIGRPRRLASPVITANSRMAGQDAAQQPRRGAGVAHVQHVRRLDAGRRCRGRRRARCRRRRASTSAPSARMAAAVRSTSSPSSRPVMRVSPTASAPNISARWLIDLSPGTRIGRQGGRRGGDGAERAAGRDMAVRWSAAPLSMRAAI